MVGVILAVLFIRKTLAHKEDLELKEKDDVNKPYIVAFQVLSLIHISDEDNKISDNCFSKGKNFGSFGVNRLKKEFFIMDKYT